MDRPYLFFLVVRGAATADVMKVCIAACLFWSGGRASHSGRMRFPTAMAGSMQPAKGKVEASYLLTHYIATTLQCNAMPCHVIADACNFSPPNLPPYLFLGCITISHVTSLCLLSHIDLVPPNCLLSLRTALHPALQCLHGVVISISPPHTYIHTYPQRQSERERDRERESVGVCVHGA
jgi:hypothetical protein